MPRDQYRGLEEIEEDLDEAQVAYEYVEHHRRTIRIPWGGSQGWGERWGEGEDEAQVADGYVGSPVARGALPK